MNPLSLEFHPRAVAEAWEARRWSARLNPAVAIRFLNELDQAVANIVAAPSQWPPHLHGTRAYQVRRFPYLVIYRETVSTLQVIAVAHVGRKPGYWKRRIS